MTDDDVFQRYRGKSILLDANLLLLLLIGAFQRERISTFKRTAQFSVDEFEVLRSLVSQFRTIITTPHLLTEVSNLANSLPEYVKEAWAAHFAAQIGTLLEVFYPASEIIAESAFNAFGLSDAAIQKASKGTLVLTDDFRLSGYLRSLGFATLNFREVTSSL